MLRETKRTDCDDMSQSVRLISCAIRCAWADRASHASTVTLALTRALPRHRWFSRLSRRRWSAHQQLRAIDEECAVLLAEQQIALWRKLATTVRADQNILLNFLTLKHSDLL